MLGRALRHEVRAFTALSDGKYVAANRQGVYHGSSEQPLMRPSIIEDQGQPLSPPRTIAVGPGDRVLWGEYTTKFRHNLPVRIYVSDDGGRSHQIAKTFEPGSIRHVHGLMYDEKLNHYWVLTGDMDEESGIGRLSADFADFSWLVRGKQCFRAASLFDLGDHLLYGTDSDKGPNAVIRLCKSTGQIERLQELDGSCMYGCRFGSWYTLSAMTGKLGDHASLWLSRDGERWHKALTGHKDRWDPTYFQHGTLVLPNGESDHEHILFSGQALEAMSGKAYVAEARGIPQE